MPFSALDVDHLIIGVVLPLLSYFRTKAMLNVVDRQDQDPLLRRHLRMTLPHSQMTLEHLLNMLL